MIINATRIFRINENMMLRMQMGNSVIRDVAPSHAVSISLKSYLQTGPTS